MIIIDFSQIARATIHAESSVRECCMNPSRDNDPIIKHHIINSLRFNVNQFKKTYGSHVILACDNGSWRNVAFPEYKYTRKQNKIKDESGIDWKYALDVVADLITELDELFPYVVISVPGCEGDDVIGVLTKHHIATSAGTTEENLFSDSEPDPVMIISSDRDHVQLHSKHVKQYSSIEKERVVPKLSPSKDLMTKIIKGDKGDGIPNIKMPNDTFVTGTRQQSIFQKELDAFYASKTPINECATDEMRANYARNEMLISYNCIPDIIQRAILAEYQAKKDVKINKMHLMNYFIKNKMNMLLNNIHDFN